jgi:Tfp pilus assembly protein PilN
MIKINLTSSKQQLDLSNLGGFDFSKLKIKALALVLVLLYVPDFFLVPFWDSEREKLQGDLNAKQDQLRDLKGKISKANDFDKQIKELKAQEETLGQKLVAVKQAISEKRNPSPLLLYIAKNVPKELWIKELEINNFEMKIKGEAMDYTSIGNFVNNLRSSVFIKEANIGNTASAVRESDKRRIETFEVSFTIARFDQ